MYDNNHPDENFAEEHNAESEMNEQNSLTQPATSLFPPGVNHYIRFAHNPTRFMVMSNLSLSNGFRAQIAAYDQFPITNVRMQFIHNNVNDTYRIRVNAVFPRTTSELQPPTPPLVTALITPTIPGGSFSINQVGNGIYEIFHPLTALFAGVRNINAQTSDVQYFADHTPEQRQWFITTDPFAPLPPQKPIEEGIYTIHTTRKPSSVMEPPRSVLMDDESEPFIKHNDGNIVQLWQFVYDRQLNAYQIICQNNMCLFAYDSGIPGTPPRQRYRLRFTSRLNQTPASYFYVNPAGDGSYTIVSVKYPDQKFDLTLGNTDNFNPVQLYQQNDYDAQNWILKRH